MYVIGVRTSQICSSIEQGHDLLVLVTVVVVSALGIMVTKVAIVFLKVVTDGVNVVVVVFVTTAVLHLL